jgi:hypothetical protein
MKKALAPDLVRENGPERRKDFKIKLFSDMDAAIPPDSIIASSSSGLTMSVMQSECKHPGTLRYWPSLQSSPRDSFGRGSGGRKNIAAISPAGYCFRRLDWGKPIHVRKEVVGHVAKSLQAALYREIVYLIEQGVLNVADSDAAVCWGLGLRWGVMGPSLLFHLGGGQGGIQHFMEHLSGPLASWWKDLGTITEFSPQIKQKVIDGVMKEAGNRSIEELERERDTMLLEPVCRTLSMSTVGFRPVDDLVPESTYRSLTLQGSRSMPARLMNWWLGVQTLCGATGTIQKKLRLRFTTGCFALVTLAIKTPTALATSGTAGKT